MKTSKSIMFAVCGLFMLAAPHLQAQTFTYTYAGPPFPIPRDDANIAVISGIFVPRNLTVTKVTVNVNIEYPTVGDLNLYFYSPQATRTRLLERNCGSRGTLRNMTFDDAAQSRYSDFCPVETGGSFRGIEPLSNFNGQDAFGTWVLATENNGSNDVVGYVLGFSITITGTAIAGKPAVRAEGVLNTASLRSGAVAPLEALLLVGAGLGPTTRVNAPAGNLPTTLGGVSVTFDGQAAAISSVSEGVLSIQAPASLQPGSTTAMRVTYQGVASDPVNLSVVAGSPAIYTQSGIGAGAVKAINQDGTVNTVATPAPKGSYVAIYANGLGTLVPALTTGQAPPSNPLSVTTAATSVIISGISAPVAFSGGAPSYPGTYQVNAQIPATAPSGANSLFLYSSGLPSQSGVLIFVQ